MLVSRLSCLRTVPVLGLRSALSQAPGGLRSPALLKSSPPLIRPQQVPNLSPCAAGDLIRATLDPLDRFACELSVVCQRCVFCSCFVLCFMLFSIRVIPPRPDWDSAGARLQKSNFRKRRFNPLQTRQLEVNSVNTSSFNQFCKIRSYRSR